MDTNQKKFNLASFKRANDGMVAANGTVYRSKYGRTYTGIVKEYTLEEVERIIESGSLIKQQELSRNYFNRDGFYKRLLIYYATLLKYVGVLIPNPSFGKDLSTNHIQKRYFNAVDFVESLNLPILLSNFALRAIVDGCYYGLIQEVDKKGVTILDLPSGWCCTRFKDTLGNDIIEFDLSYFNSIIDKEERKIALKAYPRFISTAYKKYTDGRLPSSWIFIPSDVGICFPFFDGRPLFLATIPAIIKYDDAIDIELKRDIEEIRKILVQKIPHLNDGRLLFEPDEAEEMHKGAVGMLKGNEHVSVLTTYADVDAVTSRTSADANNNTLQRMLQNVYNTTGTSSELFASTGSSTLDTSIENDTALMMVLGNKFSLFITKLVNRLFENSNISFKYNILPVTYYNYQDFADSGFKYASSGYSYLMPAIAMGLSQKDLGNIKDLENDVLKLGEKLIPLTSAYTQSGEGGRPQVDPSEKAPKTIENEESLDNQTGGSN